jgi:hypothetical protein
MNGIAVGFPGGSDHRRDVEIGRGALAFESDRLVDAANMQRRCVVLRMDADGSETELGRGAGDADGDLAAIGDQETFQHVLEIFMGKSLLIVAHAPSENTLSLRQAAERGALSETGVEVRVVAPLQAGPDDVLAAQAVILGTTENLGYMSGALKDFFDRSYIPLLEKTQGLPYALYIRAGSDGTGTRRGVETIVTGLRWRAVQEPLICRGPWQPVFVEQCEELGAAMAAGLAAGIF